MYQIDDVSVVGHLYLISLIGIYNADARFLNTWAQAWEVLKTRFTF